ncbi:MAG TPA: hypothetical protein DD730_18775 [Desulfosporosinus sp.]|jgi:hypothetical protein|nr:hypothetical protein [Desulfosporosinus sp.]
MATIWNIKTIVIDMENADYSGATSKERDYYSEFGSYAPLITRVLKEKGFEVVRIISDFPLLVEVKA